MDPGPRGSAMDWSSLSFVKDSFRAIMDPTTTWSAVWGTSGGPELLETGALPTQLIEEIVEAPLHAEKRERGEEKKLDGDGPEISPRPDEDSRLDEDEDDEYHSGDEEEEEEEEEEQADDRVIGEAVGLMSELKRARVEDGDSGAPSGAPGLRDITHLLALPQSEAAAKVGLTTSTFCKRWKEAVGQRKWPFRVLAKIDKEISTLKKKTPLSRANEAKIAQLRKLRRETLAPAAIRLNN